MLGRGCVAGHPLGAGGPGVVAGGHHLDLRQRGRWPAGPAGLLSVARRAARSGVPATVAACLLLVGVGATLSRGGALALAVGAAVLATLLGPGRTLQAAGPPTLGAGVALAGLGPPLPASRPPPPGAGA